MHNVPAVPLSPHHPDPAWRQRVASIIVSILLLWPVVVATEFYPWTLFDLQSLQSTGQFLSAFLQPAHDAEFLGMVAREAWKTIAIATCSLTLALLGAIPATLLVTERLSISRLGTGRIAAFPRVLRQLVRWLLVLLRSVPELV